MNIREKLDLIRAEISGRRAYRYVEAISGFNRVQLSEGYEKAADYCADAMAAEGVANTILQIPMGPGTNRWSQRGFYGWTCTKGILRLTDPYDTVLCDYEATPTSLIQRSCAASLRGIDIVLLDRGAMRSAYSAWDLRGKIVFVHDEPFQAFAWAMEQCGALGILTDYLPANFVRSKEDLPDAHCYHTFHWPGDADERRYFGFVLSPRQGETLKRLCQSMRAARAAAECGPYPKCDIEIVTKTGPGNAAVVDCSIPGTSREEIFITGHLCHPRPSANDNASGCGAAMEAMRAINGLIQKGLLPQPYRTIRMILVPEVCGTFAYLSDRADTLERIKAAINLDMVGRRQEGRSGMLGIWAPPDATPSFVIDLMAYIRSLSNREAPSFNIRGYVTPYHSQIMEYNGGSDHYVYCDPTVHIPCVTFMQWLDKNYHTSADTIENIDPEMLHKSASMAACWAYALASLSLDDIAPVFARMRERFLARLNAAAEDPPAGFADYSETCGYYLDTFGAACDDLLRYFPPASVSGMIDAQKAALRRLADQTADLLGPHVRGIPRAGEPSLPDERIPKRLAVGPISFIGDSLGNAAAQELFNLKSRYPDLCGYHSVDHFILFCVNGRRTVSEIARLVGFESRYYNPAYVREYLDYLKKYRVVQFGE